MDQVWTKLVGKEANAGLDDPSAQFRMIYVPNLDRILTVAQTGLHENAQAQHSSNSTSHKLGLVALP